MATEVEPPPFTKRKYTRKVKEDTTAKPALVAMIALTVNTVYHTAALKYGRHWDLVQNETADLSIAIHNALETLPGNAYVRILEYLSKYGPWVTLAYVAYTITAHRVKTTLELKRSAEQSNTVDGNNSDKQQSNVSRDWSANTDFGFNGYDKTVNREV